MTSRDFLAGCLIAMLLGICAYELLMAIDQTQMIREAMGFS
jgi:hypothetical protein